MTRSYSPGLEIVGSDLYTGGVAAVLDFIRMQSEVGRALVWEIGRGFTGFNGEIRRVGATQLAVQILPSPTDFMFAIETDARAAAARGTGEQALGTGEGSSVQIPYSPQLLPPGPALHNRQCTLVHELTHALRMKNGLINKTPIRTGNFDNAEEFFAVLVENVFRSGLGWPLRASHHGYEEMNPPRSFFEERDFQPLFGRFQSQMGSFAAALANLDSARYPYNPYREYVNSAVGMGFAAGQ